jgi:hypothetical protein
VQVASRGETSTAVTLLTKYVSLYVNDLEAWEELAAMYLQVHKGSGWNLNRHVRGTTGIRPLDKLNGCRRTEEPCRHPDMRACESLSTSATPCNLRALNRASHDGIFLKVGMTVKRVHS